MAEKNSRIVGDLRHRDAHCDVTGHYIFPSPLCTYVVVMTGVLMELSVQTSDSIDIDTQKICSNVFHLDIYLKPLRFKSKIK